MSMFNNIESAEPLALALIIILLFTSSYQVGRYSYTKVLSWKCTCAGQFPRLKLINFCDIELISQVVDMIVQLETLQNEPLLCAVILEYILR